MPYLDITPLGYFVASEDGTRPQGSMTSSTVIYPPAVPPSTRRSIAAALMSLPFECNPNNYVRLQLVGNPTIVTDTPVTVDISTEYIDVDGTATPYDYCGPTVTASGVHTPSVHTHPSGSIYGGIESSPVAGPYGTYWDASSWPTIDLLRVEYVITYADPGYPYVGAVGDTCWFLFELVGDSGILSPGDIGCRLPNWWPGLYSLDAASASEMYLSIVHFWQNVNSMDATAYWLEDSFSLDSSWPRVTLVMPVTTDVGAGVFLQRVPQYVSPAQQLQMTIDYQSAAYPCATECIEGFGDFVAALGAIAGSLVSGDDTVSSLLSDIKKTVAAAATKDISIKSTSNGTHFSSTTGVSE